MNKQRLLKRIDAMEQAIQKYRQNHIVKAIFIMPYKNHWPGETCTCVSPALIDYGSHCVIMYHQADGIDEQVDALIRRISA